MASVGLRVRVLVLLASCCCCCWKGTQGLGINITIDIEPPEASVGENRFLAAAGPVTVTCSPVEPNGTVTFEWSSTCEACPFINSTNSDIVVPYLTSGLTGNHTCIITDGNGSGESVNATQEIIVVGAGIFVTNGASISMGYHPNNSVLVTTDDDIPTDYRFRFYCLSGSVLNEQGEFIGADGDVITDDAFFNVTNDEGPGSLHIANSASGGQDAITASQQGVYTCRIPDETGETKLLNIGIYPAEFSSPPTIDAIEFEVKSQVTTLACISSVSPATTVKWMRDEQPLTIDGTVYEQTQILIDRKESIYRTVLIVNDQQDNILDHTYTCSVNNILGTATDHVKITKPTAGPDKESKTKTGVVVGVVVSLVVTALIIAAIITVACFYTRRQRQDKTVVTEEALVLKDSNKQTASSYQSINE